MRELSITTDAIKLGQLLKLANVVEAGADAKQLLSTGGVTVNGLTETRRGRQLAAGDVVAVGSAEIRLTRP